LFLTRLLTALVGAPVFLYALYVGGIPLLVVTGILISVGLTEFAGLANRGSAGFSYLGPVIGSVLFATGAHLNSLPVLHLGLAAVLLLSLGEQVFRSTSYNLETALWSLLGGLYVGFLFSIILLLRHFGPWPALMVVAAVWATDTGAYLFGVRYGRHKIGPISPNKSWEGAVGGLVGALIIIALGAVALGWPLIPAMAVGVLLSATSQVGDLFESGLKRTVGAKDSGTVLPGHGGVLDRFDGLLFAVLVASLAGQYLPWFASGI